jgi:hypothetical protein
VTISSHRIVCVSGDACVREEVSLGVLYLSSPIIEPQPVLWFFNFRRMI